MCPLNRCLVLVSGAVALTALAAAESIPGRIVVAHDVDTLASRFAGPQEERFIVNVARWLTGASSGDILAIESQPNDDTRNYAPGVKAALAAAGFNVTYINNNGNHNAVSSLTLADLQVYDAVFAGVTWPLPMTMIDSEVLTQYVNQGGNVYMFGGVDGSPELEAPFLNPFLAHFGLAFSTTVYNGLYGVAINSTHPIFDGVTALASGNGQSIFDLETYPGADIVQFAGGDGVYAVVIPEPTALVLLAAAAPAIWLRRRW